jgi:hypothetical protein
MSLWDEVTKDFGVEIEEASSDYIKATNILPYTVKEIKNVFEVEELEEVAGFIKEMQSAKNDNEKKATIISKGVRIIEGLLTLGGFLPKRI